MDIPRAHRNYLVLLVASSTIYTYEKGAGHDKNVAALCWLVLSGVPIFKWQKESGVILTRWPEGSEDKFGLTNTIQIIILSDL